MKIETPKECSDIELEFVRSYRDAPEIGQLTHDDGTLNHEALVRHQRASEATEALVSEITKRRQREVFNDLARNLKG
jgi:hypothetical protein